MSSNYNTSFQQNQYLDGYLFHISSTFYMVLGY